VDQAVAGRGVTPTALALAVDHCFGPVGLHRVQVDVRPENVASRRVVAKLGFREEALFRRYLDIDGAWRDHIGYALTPEDCPERLVARLDSAQA
jgi:ribosomal-protein-alanine N-acetyltransferase